RCVASMSWRGVLSFSTLRRPPCSPRFPYTTLFRSTRVPLTLLVVMLMLGGVFSLIPAVMWPAVAYIVRESRLGSAYSMMTLCQQVGVALVPLVVGRFNTSFGAGPEHPAGYAPGMWFYTALAALGLLFSYLLWRAESGPAAHGLEYPSGEKPA